MNLGRYVELLQDLIYDNPEAIGYMVITASDDEGNSYRENHQSPGIGHFSEEEYGEWTSEEDVAEMKKSDPDMADELDYKLNAVIVN
jgi:hypothetical protein